MQFLVKTENWKLVICLIFSCGMTGVSICTSTFPVLSLVSHISCSSAIRDSSNPRDLRFCKWALALKKISVSSPLNTLSFELNVTSQDQCSIGFHLSVGIMKKTFCFSELMLKDAYKFFFPLCRNIVNKHGLILMTLHWLLFKVCFCLLDEKAFAYIYSLSFFFFFANLNTVFLPHLHQTDYMYCYHSSGCTH